MRSLNQLMRSQFAFTRAQLANRLRRRSNDALIPYSRPAARLAEKLRPASCNHGKPGQTFLVVVIS